MLNKKDKASAMVVKLPFEDVDLSGRKTRDDEALLLLADVLGHSNIAITKRYLGIRKEEILSVYDSLD